MSEYRVRTSMPEPKVPPQHVFVPHKPEDRLMCRHEVARDQNDFPVFCNLSRAQHPLLEEDAQ